MVINYHQLECKLTSVTAIVIPTPIYACETWKRKVMMDHRVDVFHRRCLRAIDGISCSDHVTNEEVMRIAGKGRLPGYCYNKEKENGLPRPQTPDRKTSPYSYVLGARRRQKKAGRPKRTWWSTFQEDMKEVRVSWHGARRFASDRDGWRRLVARCSERNRRT